MARAAGSVRAMNAAQARRGPDAEGFEQWPGVTLGHRRLSIFDLSEAGRQPMLSEDRSIGVVFNGAIYNFLDLRAELERAGYAFHTRTDTEVLVHGYRHWGVLELLRRLRGMFAIGLWDAAGRKLFLARDRLGVKPLVYTVRNGVLAFASTVRALRDGGFAADLDQQAIAEFLEFGYVTDDRTIYEGMHKLPAGTLLEWSEGRLQSHAYWTLPTVDGASEPSFEEAVERTQALFLESVRIRLAADVPIGALLSGGVDSSLVCWATAKLGGDIRAFTVGTPNHPMDETADAVATARRIGVPHQVIEMRDDDSPGIDELISAYGEPFACASALGMLRISKAVRSEATVLLTGDGGDDVFLGYPEHKKLWAAQRIAARLPSAATPAWKSLRALVPDRGLARRARNFLDYTAGGMGALAQIHDGLPLYRSQGLLGGRLVNCDVGHRQMPWSAASARGLLAGFLVYDRRTRFTGEYMTKVDGATMYYAVEARSPFLDHELWEYAASLPFGLRLRNGALKSILREIAARNIGPRVAQGVKRGFGVPVRNWLAGRWGEDFRGAMSDSLLAREGYIDSERVLEFWRRRASTGDVPNQLWYLFVLETWMRHELKRAAAVPDLTLQ